MYGQYLSGHIAAVILADEILESNVHAPGISLEAAGIKVIAEGDKPGVEQRKHTLYEIASLQAVAAKAGEVLYDNAVHLVCTDKLNKLLYRWPLER